MVGITNTLPLVEVGDGLFKPFACQFEIISERFDQLRSSTLLTLLQPPRAPAVARGRVIGYAPLAK